MLSKPCKIKKQRFKRIPKLNTRKCKYFQRYNYKDAQYLHYFKTELLPPPLESGKNARVNWEKTGRS